MEWFFPVAFLIGFLTFYLVLRKETADNSLTKRGFIKFLGVFAVIFLISFGVVFFLN
jgi:hypothetical protein